jgi:hypothetical protein
MKFTQQWLSLIMLLSWQWLMVMEVGSHLAIAGQLPASNSSRSANTNNVSGINNASNRTVNNASNIGNANNINNINNVTIVNKANNSMVAQTEAPKDVAGDVNIGRDANEAININEAINVKTSIIANKPVHIGDQITIKIEVRHPANLQITLAGNVTPLTPFELVAAPTTLRSTLADGGISVSGANGGTGGKVIDGATSHHTNENGTNDNTTNGGNINGINETSGIVRTEFLLVIAPFQTGELTLPVWEVVANGLIRRQSSALAIVVTALATEADSTIKPVELMPSPPPSAWLQSRNAIVGIGTLLIYVVGQGIVGVYRRRSVVLPAPAGARVSLPPTLPTLEEQTITQLQIILRQAKITGNLEPFYTQLAEIVNSYLMARYQIVLKSLTTAEITTLLVEQQASGQLVQVYQQLLTLCDWAKYATVMLPLTKAEPLINQMITLLQEFATSMSAEHSPTPAATAKAAATLAATPIRTAVVSSPSGAVSSTKVATSSPEERQQ